MDGDAPGPENVDRVVGQLSSLMRDGYKLSNADVKTASDLVAQDQSVDLREHFLKGSLTPGGQAPRRAEDDQPAPLSRRHRRQRHRVRHRPGRHRQDLPGDGAGRVVSGRQEGQPHHPGAAGGRGGREARASCRAICRRRSTRTCGRCTTRCTTCSTSSASARYIERGTIEIAPIAFMRGRTLNDSFVILDEAQNTTSEQMKMFLTRLGFGSKAVITGDITQIDLPPGRMSGLVEAMKVVSDIDGISFVYFDERDVVRHKLVQQIVKAYEAFSSNGSRAGHG